MSQDMSGFPGGSTALSYDPHYSSVVSLLRFKEAVGSTTFRDDKGLVWTTTGSAAIVANPRAPNGTILRTNGGYITSATLAALGFGAEEYTFEGWAASNGVGSARTIIDTRIGGAGVGIYSSVSDLKLNFANNAAILGVGTATMGDATLIHWAVAREMVGGIGTVRGFVDGILQFTVTDSRTLAASTSFRYGANSSAGQLYANDLAEQRVTRGVCRYKAGFVPDYGPFPGG